MILSKAIPLKARIGQTTLKRLNNASGTKFANHIRTAT